MGKSIQIKLFGNLCITLCPFLFCNHLEEEEKAGCFAVIVLQMYCYYKCSVALPHGAMGWSAVYECGISLSYSLTFWLKVCIIILQCNNMCSLPYMRLLLLPRVSL